MKKYSLAVAIAIGLATSSITHAQDTPPYENWVGVFGQYYIADSDKNPPVGGLDSGRGFGGEIGFRFDSNWAARFELGRLLIDNDRVDWLRDDGTQLGLDAMYFFEDDIAYVFGGIREQSLNSDDYRMASMGVGKHWEVAEKWRVITELGYYFDFGQGYKDYSAKLGLAYIFGSPSVPSTPKNLDSDNDGVYDAIDRCPNTPMGTQVDATGCNIDLDGDGVPNALDQCPNTPANSNVDAKGCAIKDSDNDGVIDSLDSCPNTAPGAEVNAKGCAVELDSDNDGVLDSVDDCLNTPMTDKVDENGCSIFEQSEVSMELDILFANNSSIISNPDSQKIVEFVAFMKRYPNTQAVIEGHSSAVGDAGYNQMLSEKRAQSVKTLLVDDYRIDESRLTAVGYGESRLKDTSNTAEAHRVNRRIEVKVTAIIEQKVTR